MSLPSAAACPLRQTATTGRFDTSTARVSATSVRCPTGEAERRSRFICVDEEHSCAAKGDRACEKPVMSPGFAQRPAGCPCEFTNSRDGSRIPAGYVGALELQLADTVIDHAADGEDLAESHALGMLKCVAVVQQRFELVCSSSQLVTPTVDLGPFG